MKKIMSLILSSIILLSSFALLPATAFAKTTKPKETTYIASCGVYKNSFGKVFASKDKLVFQDKKEKRLYWTRQVMIFMIRGTENTFFI